MNAIALRSRCSVAEVVESALDDWAESASLALELTEGMGVIGIGSFEVPQRGEQ